MRVRLRLWGVHGSASSASLRWQLVAVLLLFADVNEATAQNAAKPPRPIQDNSFLIEEAYNQEARVVQHIGVFQHDRLGPSTFEFTQEWPLRGMRHQFSYSVPFQLNGDRGVGDVMLNYRYQLRGDGDAIIAVAPRFSVLLPNESDGGLEASIPASIWIARQLIAHSNATFGITLHPEDQVTDGGGDGSRNTVSLGQSLIWLAHQNFNVLLEATWETEEGRFPSSPSTRRAILSPGIRGAINLSSGMQIVPGIAVPFGIGPSKGERSLFVYFSVEHGF